MAQARLSVGDLIREGPYARRGSTAARYAARFYRRIIFALTCVILLVSLLDIRSHAAFVRLLLVAAIVGYTLYYGARAWLHLRDEKILNLPITQVIRCQLGLLFTSALIACLAVFGVYDQQLWLLYVLSTFVLSETVSTPVVIATLVEVAVLLFAASYVLPALVLARMGQPAVNLLSPTTYVIEVLWIWLLTFVLHYLMRNIQARQAAFNQHVQWQALLASQLDNDGNPSVQRDSVLKGAAQLTGAETSLWLPRLTDGKLINDRGEEAPAVIEAVATGPDRPAVVLASAQHRPWWRRLEARARERFPVSNVHRPLYLPQSPTRPDASAQILVPMKRPGAPVMGVLEVTYTDSLSSSVAFQLELDSQRLQDFVADAIVLLTISLRNERLLLLNRLAVAWDDPLDGSTAARQVAGNVTSTLGFDFATVSLVDPEHNQICAEAGSNAGWVEESRHDLSDDDVQCLVVCEGVTIVNDGRYEPYLDSKIWERHGHARMTRIWVPIKQPRGKGPQEVFGTIEAGFYHEHCREISEELGWLLQRYAEMVFPVLLNARQQTRYEKLAATLKKLNNVGDRLNQQAASLHVNEMAALIGRCAEEVLGADLVMVYLPHKGRKRPKLVYTTEEPARGLLAEDRAHITPYLSDALALQLSSDRAPYFSPHAQGDPILVRFGLDGLPDGRSFTQRHGIRSFAGVPLITKAGDIIGYLCLNYLVHHEFYPEIEETVRLFAEQAAAALQQTREQRLALAVAIEHERSEMAAIVHNRLSGGLATNYTLALTAVEYARSGDARLAEKLQELVRSIDQNKAELRQLLVDVRGVEELPIELARGVEARVEISRRLQRGQVGLDSHVDPSVKVPPAVRRAVLNVLREALSNAEMHARGSNVNVTFRVDAREGIDLKVVDNGPGFDEAHLPEKGRNGLFSLQVFADQIGVPLTLRSSPGKGTLVGIRIPRHVMEDHNE